MPRPTPRGDAPRALEEQPGFTELLDQLHDAHVREIGLCKAEADRLLQVLHNRAPRAESPVRTNGFGASAQCDGDDVRDPANPEAGMQLEMMIGERSGQCQELPKTEVHVKDAQVNPQYGSDQSAAGLKHRWCPQLRKNDDSATDLTHVFQIPTLRGMADGLSDGISVTRNFRHKSFISFARQSVDHYYFEIFIGILIALNTIVLVFEAQYRGCGAFVLLWRYINVTC